MIAARAVGGGVVADAVELREAIAFEIAYGGVRDEARALARRVDLAIMRRKLKAAKAACGLYRVAKGFVSVDAGPVRPHVAEMRQALAGSRRRKKPAAADVGAEAG